MFSKVYAVDISQSFGPAKYFTDIASFINIFIPLMFTAASIGTLFVLIWGAYTFLTAGGEPEQVQKARKIFQFAILGFVIVMVSFLVARLIAKILNINLFI